jgi:hypothetical protein
MRVIFSYVFTLLDLLIIELFNLYGQPLHAKAPSFIGDKRINLSWKEATKSASTTAPAVGYCILFIFLLLKIFYSFFPFESTLYHHI